MDAAWLDVLSGLDKMVLGSIVGSVILAFFLLIAVFSVKIKSQQDRIGALRKAFENCTQETQKYKETIADHLRRDTDTQRVMEQYRQEADQHRETEASLRRELKKVHHTVKELRQAAALFEEVKQKLVRETEKTRQELLASREEVQAVLRRNEFWVEQLSELRTKHEALKLKLKKQERRE